MSTLTIQPDVQDVLRRSTVTEKLLVLPPGQLERKLYLDVAKVIENAGGCWSKKQKGFLFPEDPRQVLGLALDTGRIENKVDDAKAEKREFQSFYTPPELAKRVVELADIREGNFVLEPSCGEGALVRALLESGIDFGGLTAVELNPKAIAVTRDLVEACDGEINLIEGDFLTQKFRDGDFDRIVMNPPFGGPKRNQDVEHVRHALRLLARDGVLVAIMSANTGRTAFQELLFGHDYTIEPVPAGAFRDAGTDVATIILTLRKIR
jgi:predicted RNA methylase